MFGNMKIAIIGLGALGTDLYKELKKNNEVIGLTHKDIDITNRESIEKIAWFKQDVVISTAAYHNVDKCEENPDKAYQVNYLGTKYLIEYLNSFENPPIFVWFSTDYVFDGKPKEPYPDYLLNNSLEYPNPINIYGKSKLAGEDIIPIKNNFIFRISSLFGSTPPSGKKENFVDLMIRLAKEKGVVKVVADQFMTPTYTKDVAEMLPKIIFSDKYGLYHLSNEGQCRWYDFAVEIFKQMKTTVKVIPVSSKEFPTIAKRPKYSVLENRQLKEEFNLTMPHWKEALKRYLNEKHKNKN